MGNLKSKTVQVSGDESTSKQKGRKLNLSKFFKSTKKGKSEKPAEGTENGKVVEDTGKDKDGETKEEDQAKAASIDVEASVCPKDGENIPHIDAESEKPTEKTETDEKTEDAEANKETKPEAEESKETPAETTQESSTTVTVETTTEESKEESKEETEATPAETSDVTTEETKTDDVKEEQKTESSEPAAEEQAAQ